MRGGFYGNVMQGCCLNSHATGNSGYKRECLQPNHVRAVILLDSNIKLLVLNSAILLDKCYSDPDYAIMRLCDYAIMWTPIMI